MEIKSLRHLLAIDRLGSISQAADALGLAQPALSLSLSRIEKELGLVLFKRSRLGVIATEAGRQLIDEAALAVERVDWVSALGQRLAAGQSGTISVGFISSALYELLPRALSTFRTRFSHVSIELCEMNSTDQLEALSDGRIDVGFSRSPIASTRYVKEERVSSEALVAAVPEHFPVEEDGSVTLQAIADFGLILAPETQGTVRARVLYAMRRAGIEPKIAQEAHRGLTMLSCVSAGLGVALMPSSVQRMSFRGVRFCPLQPEVLPTLDISVIWRPSAKPLLADRFVDCVRRLAD